LEAYLEDVVRQCLANREDKPAFRARAYFARVANSKHVAGREYDYINATAWNKRSFVYAFHETIAHLLSESVTVGDFHQLLQLLCHDFPRAPLDACVHALPRALVGEGRAKCSHLASAFEVHWFYAPFFAALEPAFRGVGRQDSSTTFASSGGATNKPLALADVAQAVLHLDAPRPPRCMHHDCAALPWPAVRAALSAAGFDKTISFRKLVQCLLQSEAVAMRLRRPPPLRAGKAVAESGKDVAESGKAVAKKETGKPAKKAPSQASAEGSSSDASTSSESEAPADAKPRSPTKRVKPVRKKSMTRNSGPDRNSGGDAP